MKSVFVKILFLFICFSFFTTSASASSKSPQEVCALFLEGLLLGKAELIDEVVIPDDNIHLLKDDAFMLSTTDSMEMLHFATYKTLSPGDMVLLSGDSEFVVEDYMVSEENAVVFVTIEEEPLAFPFYIHKIEGVWKVDATPIIESRLLYYEELEPGSELQTQP